MDAYDREFLFLGAGLINPCLLAHNFLIWCAGLLNTHADQNRTLLSDGVILLFSVVY